MKAKLRDYYLFTGHASQPGMLLSNHCLVFFSSLSVQTLSVGDKGEFFGGFRSVKGLYESNEVVYSTEEEGASES